MVASVGGGSVILLPRFYVFNRSAQFARGPGRECHVRIEEDLCAETATYFRGDHAYLVLGNAEHEGGKQDLHHMWRLTGHPDGNLTGCRVIIGERAACLHRRRN